MMVKKKNIKINKSKDFLKKTIYEDISLYKKKSKKKIPMEDFCIPDFNDYMYIVERNFNVKQLKMICKEYKLKITGCKNELKSRTFNYLKYSNYSRKIQSVFRGCLVRKLNSMKGPALYNRKCTNETDFLMFEDVKDVTYEQFFSYKDKDGFIYGFNICSLFNLLFVENNGKESINPYNRKPIPKQVKENVKSIQKISQFLNLNTNIVVKNDLDILSFKKKVELKCTDIFQIFDDLGHTTQPNWFYDLNKQQLLKFINELVDVWNYRLNLSNSLKRKICVPDGNPFLGLSIHSLFQKELDKIRNGLLNIIKKFVTCGQDNSSKSLGGYYVLGCLTLVSQNAALSLPWLYETFTYN